MKYEKIQTLWKRDPEKKYCIMLDHFSKDVFGMINRWVITEKVDGMNIRIIYNKDGVRFAGRTDKAFIPDQLLTMLRETFTREKMSTQFDLTFAKEIILYGEGYGAKIQKGGNYRQDQSFILFDIRIDGIWLDIEKVATFAYHLGIDSVPVWGNGTVEQIMNLVKTKPNSAIEGADCVIEGFVCRSDPLLLDRFGNRVIWKIKVRDFDQLEKVMMK